MHKLLPFATVAALCSLAGAQQLLVPLAQNFSNTGTSTAVFRSTLFRFQMQYDDTIFAGAGVTGPITINRIRFRAADGVPNAGGQVYAGVTVRMAHNTLDYTAMSTTFATNLANPAGGATVFGPANVTAGAVAGTVPNGYMIDLTLTTPFIYDPAQGDLVIDVDAPTAPSPSNVPAFATSSTAAHRGRRNSTGTASATTGALSDFAAACRLDFTGPGGYGDLTGAQVHAYGAGCNTAASSFYELFNFGDPFDLAPGGLTLTPSGPDNYTVTAGAGPVQPPSATATLLSTADDATVTSTLPFTLNFPGGNTTVISSCTNGFIWLGTNTSTDFSVTVLEFRNQMARVAPYWHDFHAGKNTVTHPGAGMYFEYDNVTNPADPVALVTWKDVGVFRSTTTAPTGGHCVANFQVAIHQNNGAIEIRYGSLDTAVGQGVGITGFSRGGTTAAPAADSGSRNLSHEVPFTTTGPDNASVTPLTLAASPRPALGTTVTLTASNIPSASVGTFILLSTSALQPGIDLGFLGAPFCKASVNLAGVFLSVPVGPPPTGGFPLPIPSAPSLISLTVPSQAASIVPGANPLGLISSNGVFLTVGHL